MQNLLIMPLCRAAFRFEAVCLRQKFEENRHLTDAIKVQTLIEDTQEKLFKNKHTHPLKCNILISFVVYTFFFKF